ncbi:MAG TPA: hypothetical protein VMH28_19000 [Candidatus Acidoferrales bacterium]|nr:hypothetical protein [Candidatus Acidoferrales bacterium]
MFPESNCIHDTDDCPICYAAHDDEIHAATLRLHGWFHNLVTHRLEQEEFFAEAHAQVA